MSEQGQAAMNKELEFHILLYLNQRVNELHDVEDVRLAEETCVPLEQVQEELRIMASRGLVELPEHFGPSSRNSVRITAAGQQALRQSVDDTNKRHIGFSGPE